MLLSQPITVNQLRIPNRVVMPPMATRSSAEGHVTPEMIEHYKSRAEGGAGLIITEHCHVETRGRTDPRQLSLADDSAVPGLAKLVESVHGARAAGFAQVPEQRTHQGQSSMTENKRGNAPGRTKIFAQINHAGSQIQPSAAEGELVSASAVPHPAVRDAILPRPLSMAEIAGLVKRFADAAARAREAGFDGVEIHAAHGYLLNQFYSPLTNKRTDAYGAGSIKNRLRFILEILEEIRREAGRDFPIAVRLGGADYMEGGSSIEDSVAAARMLEQAGVDLLDISGGMCRYTRSGHTEAGWFGDMSSAVKKAVSIPVLLTGGITTGEEAEKLLQEGAADMIGVGRAMLGAPAWARHALAGHCPFHSNA